MPQILTIALAAIWLIGAWLWILRGARYYQIEEYMSRRYLRWAYAKRRRYLPARTQAAFVIGLLLATLLSEAPDSLVPSLIATVAAVIAVVPERESEVKKQLVATQRVKRILLVAGLLSALVLGASTLALREFSEAEPIPVAIAVTSGPGFITFLLAPLWLVLGNTVMQPLEIWLRRRYRKRAEGVLAAIRPKIIGITGSYGKTTTKNFMRDILSLRYQTYATPKSYNTLMGIALAINRDLADDYRTEYFISEMGAYVEGEIARICQLTPPDIAVVTEVGPQHLERFGSLENIKRAKYEIIKSLPPDGVAVFNWDNVLIRAMIAKGYPAIRLSVSRELSLEDARKSGVTWIAGEIAESLEGLSFTATQVASGEDTAISTSIIGGHNVTNLLLCIAVAHHEGIPLRDIALHMRSLKPAESRLARETTAAGVTIINDAYSANPLGVISALKVLGMHKSGARLLITPGMIELGDLQEEENRKLGMLATEYATDIILVGPAQTRSILQAIHSTAFDPARVHVVSTLQESVAWYQRNLKAGDAVLFLNDLPDTY